MKIEYDPAIDRWLVKGLGYFHSRKDAEDAIAARASPEKRYTQTLKALVTVKMLNDLQAMAKRRKVSVAAVVRDAIEKELETWQ